MSAEASLRPAPWVTRDSQFFWDAARREELVAQACGSCGALRTPPRPMCPHCNSLERREQVLSGRGTVHTWVMPRYPVIPGVAEGTIVAVIELDEGVRMVSAICDIDYDDITRDMPVEVFFEPTEGDFKIPLFRPAA